MCRKCELVYDEYVRVKVRNPEDPRLPLLASQYNNCPDCGGHYE